MPSFSRVVHYVGDSQLGSLKLHQNPFENIHNGAVEIIQTA